MTADTPGARARRRAGNEPKRKRAREDRRQPIEPHAAMPPQSGRICSGKSEPAREPILPNNEADEKGQMVARAAISSAIAAARVVSVVDQPSDSVALWGILAGQLQASSKRISAGDLAEVEEMLVHQAVALQSIFVKLTEGALQAESLANFDLKFRYALRAQSQCRATLETLAAIKNPPTVFARQANVTTGPQQINNGAEPRVRAGENAFEPNEQSGGVYELRQNGGTPALARGADTALAAVGAIDGATDRGRQGAVVRQRLEGRMAPAAPGVEQDAGRATAKN